MCKKWKCDFVPHDVQRTNVFFLHVLVIVSYTLSPALGVNSYDFIIVGGGTAGCALARRLSDDGRFSVLLLESGDVPKDDMDIPAYAPLFFDDHDVTFQLEAVPQRNAGLRTNGSLSLITGRMLSGTSSLNYMFFNRGSPHDYDNWADVTHDESWSYSNMLKYFKRIETYDGDYPSDQHGYNGPITITRPKFAPGLDTWFAAGQSLGYQIADPNGPQTISFTPIEFNKQHGRRVSSFRGYLEPILRSRRNLHITTNSNATQIIFQRKKAVGVRFVTRFANSEERESIAYSTKEIILSAGSYGSPLLLMKSGIGPRDVLRIAKIPIIHELPVGKNLQDHLTFPINIVINDTSQVVNASRDLTPAFLQFLNRIGDGPFSTTRGATGQAFVASSVSYFDSYPDWADLQLVMSHSSDTFLFSDSSANNELESGDTLMSGVIFLGRPKSRGSVSLSANDTLLIDFNYLSDPRDMEVALDGISTMLDIFEKTEAYQKLGARFMATDIPDCDIFKFRSEDYWRCYVRYSTVNGCHPSGTCQMGWGPTDPNAVVDPKLRIIGVNGLRVVDASIMPYIVNANPQASIYAIAEKAADMILEQWQPYTSPLPQQYIQSPTLY